MRYLAKRYVTAFQLSLFIYGSVVWAGSETTSTHTFRYEKEGQVIIGKRKVTDEDSEGIRTVTIG